MRVLVGYASAYGSTKGIATGIGDRLTRAGFEVDVRPVDEIETIDGFDAVVLGSAIHSMSWLPQAAAFVRSHTAALAVRPDWLFSVSSVGDTSSFFGPRVARFMRRMRHEPRDIAGMRQAIGPRDHRNFAGAVDRDWRDVDAWADGIARQLVGGPEAGS